MTIDFPILDENDYTRIRKQLHSLARIIGRFREVLVKATVKNGNLWLNVYENGFRIPLMEQYGELEINVNLQKLRVEVVNPNIIYTVDIDGDSTSSIEVELVKILGELQIGIDESKISLGFEHDFDLDRESTGQFLTQMVNYNDLLKAFQKTIHEGTKTQICLWPHHFDNAFIWYSGNQINGIDGQIEIGVSNGDESSALPYIYMTPWPIPAGIGEIRLTDGASLHTEGWTGVILPYKTVEGERNYEAQKELISVFLNTTFEQLNKEL